MDTPFFIWESRTGEPFVKDFEVDQVSGRGAINVDPVLVAIVARLSSDIGPGGALEVRDASDVVLLRVSVPAP